MFKMPTPTQVYLEIKNAIEQNKRPTVLLHAWLTSGATEANIIWGQIENNKAALKVLTSPKGRAWMRYWLEDTLNFLQRIAESQ